MQRKIITPSRRKFLGGVVGASVAAKIATSATPARAADVIRVAYPTSDHYAPVFVAKQQKWFEQANLQMDYKSFAVGGPIIEGLTSKSIDIGFLGIPGLISVARKFQLTSVMGMALEGSGIVTTGDRVNEIRDLAGKNVGMPARGSIAHLLLLRALTGANVDPTSVRIVEVGDPEGLRLGLMRGEVDAAVTWEPWISQYEQTKGIRKLALSHDLWPRHQCDYMWVSSSFLKERPDAVKAVIDVVIKGMQSVTRNVAVAASDVSEALKTPVAVEQIAMQRQQYTPILEQQNIQDEYALLAGVGILKTSEIPPWDRLVDPEMYDYATKKWAASQKT